MKNKLILSSTALLALIVGAVGLSAFEAHVINVTARIENSLDVPIEELSFGTVFPQEAFDETFDVSLSESFIGEDRVDDVEYILRQKPKCADNPENPAEFSQVTEDEAGNFVCANSSHAMLPLLCPYLSKSEITNDGAEQENDGKPILAFHDLSSKTTGTLAKSAQDISDTWNIDLKVPCFWNHCGQDWDEFVRAINPDVNPQDYIQPIQNERKVFGCDLWLEVSKVSLPGEPNPPAPPEPVTLLFDDFTDRRILDTWSAAFLDPDETGEPRDRVDPVSSVNSYQGVSARLQDHVLLYQSVSTVGYEDINLAYCRKTLNLDTNEYLRVGFKTGAFSSTWSEWAELETTEAEVWDCVNFDLPASTNNGAVLIGFFNDANSGNDSSWVDQVTMSGNAI